MKRIIITIFIISCSTFIFSGCSQSTWLYRVNVQQGNVVTSDMLQEIHQGMTKEAVCEHLGPPILVNAFNDNRWTYIYTSKASRGSFIRRNLILYFRNGRVEKVFTQNLS